MSGPQSFWHRNVSALIPVVINTAAGGDIVIQPAIPNFTTKLYRLLLLVSGTTSITIKDGSTPMSGPLQFTTGGGMVLDFSGDPWYVGSPNTAFIINSSNAVQVSGTAWIVILT